MTVVLMIPCPMFAFKVVAKARDVFGHKPWMFGLVDENNDGKGR